MISIENMNLVKLFQQFGNEDDCLECLEDLRWPDGVKCPRCKSDRITHINGGHKFHCNSCLYQFTTTSGTIFHDSHLPLSKWFMTVYLMIESKKGISANQLKRMIGVSYKTAWYLCHRIRSAMKDESDDILMGIVEVDETWIGGKRKGVGSGNRTGKTLAVGAIQRGGKIKLKVIKAADKKTLHAFIRKHTEPDTEAIYTDEWGGYRGIADHDTRHETVNHSEEEWVRGDVHTNSVESVWSLLKRSLVGSYHKMSVKHLEAYLQELEWRFNNRHNPWLFRDTLRKLIQADKLEYKKLTA